MNLAIIAIQFENRYYSINCFYDGPPRILEILDIRCPVESAALRFVAQGDIEMRVGFGITLKGNSAQEHVSPVSLASYAVNSSAYRLYVFENGAWDSIPLYREEILDIAANE